MITLKKNNLQKHQKLLLIKRDKKLELKAGPFEEQRRTENAGPWAEIWSNMFIK